MNFTVIQNNFNSGEVSPRLWGRRDTPLVKNGVAVMENMVPTLHGSAWSRNGTRHVTFLRGVDKEVRVFDFKARDGNEYTLEFDDGVLRAYNSTGPIPLSEVAVELVTNGAFTTDISGWTPVELAGWEAGRLRLGERYGFGQVPGKGMAHQAIVLPADGTLTVTFDIEEHSTQPVQVPGAVSMNERTYRSFEPSRLFVRLGSTPGSSTEWWNHYNTASQKRVSFSIDLVAGTYYLTFELGETRFYTTYERRTIDGPVFTSNTPKDGYSPVVHTVEIGGFALVDNVSAGIRVTGDFDIPSPWTLAQLEELRMVEEPAKDRVFFFHPNVQTRVLTRDAAGLFTIGTAAFVTTPGQSPAEWTGTNWPSVGVIYQGRLFVGATPARPNTFWASVSGDLLDFRLGNTNSDAMSLDLSTKSKIQWMKGRRHLLIGTEDDEFSVTSRVGPITPSDYDIRLESSYGSAALDAVSADAALMWVSKDRQRVFAMAWAGVDEWQTKELTFPGEHITAPGIKSIAFMRGKIPTVFCLLYDGKIACCTFSVVQEVVGWWKFSTHLGYVRSMAVARAAQSESLMLAVDRSGELDAPLRLERFHMRDEIGGEFRLDARVDARYTLVSQLGPPSAYCERMGEMIGLHPYVVWREPRDQAPRRGYYQIYANPLSTTLPITDYLGGWTYSAVEPGAQLGVLVFSTLRLLPLETPDGAAFGTQKSSLHPAVMLSRSSRPFLSGEKVLRDSEKQQDVYQQPREENVSAILFGQSTDYEEQMEFTYSEPGRCEILAVGGLSSVSEVG